MAYCGVDRVTDYFQQKYRDCDYFAYEEEILMHVACIPSIIGGIGQKMTMVQA
jgi:hypothetical protein